MNQFRAWQSVSQSLLTRALLAVLAWVSFAGCKGQEVVLSVFHTNDLHYQLHPIRSDAFGLGGMARLSGLLKSKRADLNHPSVVLDAGDWSEGNWYYNLDAGEGMLRIFKTMGMDATVVGNHDYLSRPDTLWRMIEGADVQGKVATLGANFDLSAYDQPENFRKYIPSSVILERSGMKIGVIGLSTFDYVFSFWLDPVKTQEPIEVAQRIANELRPQVDVLLVVSHNSFSVNEQIARSVSGIDAVISGHSHHKTVKPSLIENAGRLIPVVETGSWGRFLGELRLGVDVVTKSVRFLDYALTPVDSSAPEDSDVEAIVEDMDRRLNEIAGEDINRVVSATEVALSHDDAREANLGSVATQAYRFAVPQAVAALETLALTGIKVKKGPLTVQDLHDVMPHIYDFEGTRKEWTIKLWNARGSDLALFINLITLTNTFALDRTGFFAHDGIEVVYEPKTDANPVARVKEIRVGGERLDPAKRYPVALLDGTLMAIRIASEKFFLGVDFSELMETGIEGPRAVIAYGKTVPLFTEASLRSGARTYTTTADPAIHHYGIQLATDEAGEASGVRVRVANDGLTAARKIELECWTGKGNDPIVHDSPEQEYESLGKMEIDRLESLSSVEKELSWKAWREPSVGALPIKCVVRSAGDGYDGNSQALTVLRIPQVKTETDEE